LAFVLLSFASNHHGVFSALLCISVLCAVLNCAVSAQIQSFRFYRMIRITER